MLDFAAKVALAKALWAAWSSGDPDAPGALVTPDFDLNDTAFGHHTSWVDARMFFAATVGNFPDLVMRPELFFENPADGSLSLTWTMTGTYAPTGGRFSVPGMSLLRFKGDRVCAEIDYYDSKPVRDALPAEISALL
jgi:ketosteroid isomerase-like protein